MKRTAEDDLFSPLYDGITVKKQLTEAPKLENGEQLETEISRVPCYHAELKGERDSMEDYYVIESSFELGVPGISKCAVVALFDGHAGPKCAEFCSKNIIKTLEKNVKKAGLSLEQIQMNAKKIFMETFRQLDDEFLLLSRKSSPKLKDGCTATVLLLIDSVIYCANVGDSKAIVARKKEVDIIPLSLTEDHTALIFEERQRIQKAGGFVKDGRVMGISELSRAIGDEGLKKNGVISTPSVKKITLTENDKFILVACDGLWKAFTEIEVIKRVMSTFRNPAPDETEEATKIYSQIPSDLASAAVLKGCGDNVTVLFLPLQ